MAEKREEKKKGNLQTSPKKEDGQGEASGPKSADVKDPGSKPLRAEGSVAKVPGTKASGTAVSDTEKQPEKEESYLKDLMAISGHGGLFRFVSQGRNGIIVESLDTGKRMQAFASMKVSALDDIAVYKKDEEVQLEQVLAAIYKYENGKETISPKSDADDLRDYFSAVMPEYDRERVYVSDIKKILGWYNLLLKHKLIDLEKSAGKSHEKKDETRKDHPHPAAKPVGRTPVRKEGGGVHTRAETRIPGKKIAGSGKKSP